LLAAAAAAAAADDDEEEDHMMCDALMSSVSVIVSQTPTSRASNAPGDPTG